MEASGYHIIRYKINSKIKPIEFEVSNYFLRPLRQNDTTHYFVITNNALEDIALQLNQEVEVFNITPDTIVFNFDKIIAKKIKVNPVLNLSFEKQFMSLGDTIVTPDSVTVLAAASIMDSIHSINTKPIDLNRIKKPIEKTIALEKPEGIDFTKKKVDVYLDVDQFTEASIEIPILPQNVPDTLHLVTFPKNIKVIYHVPLKQYDLVEPQLFRATVDYATINQNLSDRLKVNMDRIPEFIKLKSYRPKHVEYIIEK